MGHGSVSEKRKEHEQYCVRHYQLDFLVRLTFKESADGAAFSLHVEGVQSRGGLKARNQN
jgi:hypothetical protein